MFLKALGDWNLNEGGLVKESLKLPLKTLRTIRTLTTIWVNVVSVLNVLKIKKI